MISEVKEIVGKIVKESGPKVESVRRHEMGNIKRRALGDLFLFRVY